MDQVTFAMPVSSTMSPADQINVLLNQATAVIVSNYLQHMNTVINKQGLENNLSFAHQAVLSPAELVTLIDSVQTALKSI